MKAPFSSRLNRVPRSRGFTLIEAMMVVAIVAILTALAAPSMKDAINRYRVGAVYDELRSTYMFARSEALRTRQQVVVAQIPNTANCTAGSAQEWKCGWEVYVDVDASFTRNNAEQSLKVIDPVPTNIDVMWKGPNPGNRVVFDRWGNVTPLGAFSQRIVPDGSVASPQTSTLCMSAGNRIRKVAGITC